MFSYHLLYAISRIFCIRGLFIFPPLYLRIFSTYNHLISPHKSLCVYLFTMNPACLLSPIASFNLPLQVAMCLFVYYEPGMFTLPNCVSSVVWPVFVLFFCFVFSLHVLLNHAVSSWCGGD